MIDLPPEKEQAYLYGLPVKLAFGLSITPSIMLLTNLLILTYRGGMMKRFILRWMTAAAMGSISSGSGAQSRARAGRIEFNGVITATAGQIEGNNQQMT